MHEALLAVAGLVLCTAVASGQAAVSGPVPSILFSTPAQTPLRVSAVRVSADSIERDIRPTHWKEGALVGAIVGGVAGALLGGAICRNSEELGRNCTGSAIVGGVLAGLVLAIPGALIGGQIPKGGTTP